MDIKKRIDKLGPWYQNIDLGGVRTMHRGPSTIELWNQLLNVLPESLEGLRILDLGCNAGHFSYQAAVRGASVIGINVEGKGQRWRKQAEFVKNYFEEQHGKLDITYIWKDILDVDFDSLGRFDYVFALAVLYHVGRNRFGHATPETWAAQKQTMKKLTEISDKVIVRTRPGKYKGIRYHDNIFCGFGWKSTILHKAAKRSLILYERQ